MSAAKVVHKFLVYEYKPSSYQFVSELSVRTSATASNTSWEILTPLEGNI